LQRFARGFAGPALSLYSVNGPMGSFRLRQGPLQHRLTGITWRSTLLGFVLGVGLLVAVPSAANAAADLSITKTAAPEPVLVGQELTYTITVQNSGPDPATTVTVTDTLPAGVSFVSATTPQCSESAGTVTCNLDTIPSTQQASVEIKVRPTAEGQITNTASVSSPDDPLSPRSSTPVQTTVSPVADLMVTMTAVPDPVVAGELLTYTLVVENKGPSDATAARVTDILPAGVSFVAAGSHCLEFNGTVTCKVDAVPSGQRATFDITVRPQSAGSITNQVQVDSAVMDPDPTNDTATLQTTVSPAPSPPTPSTGGPTQPSSSLNVVLTGSYVLISGRSVKLVKGKFIPVKLTCAGQRKCEGTITVTTAKAVANAKKHRKGRKQKRRVARLGSKRFSIEGNRQQMVLVPLTKSKIKLLRRLKRVKAKAAIREIDLKGNPRISTRTFTLRAR
jgi:uncharacterized repeat protein (TIGR01451 family)